MQCVVYCKLAIVFALLGGVVMTCLKGTGVGEEEKKNEEGMYVQNTVEDLRKTRHGVRSAVTLAMCYALAQTTVHLVRGKDEVGE